MCRRILDASHVPYVFVPLDPDDRVDADGHPDADGAREIAEAVADALRRNSGDLPAHFTPARTSATCAALIVVTNAVIVGSVYMSGANPSVERPPSSAVRSSLM